MAFDPKVHGFAYENRWVLDETERGEIRQALTTAISGVLLALRPSWYVPLVALRIPGKLSDWIAQDLPDVYGLCGGMTYASLDYFRLGLPPPSGNGRFDQPTRATAQGQAMRDYLLKRSLDSLTAGQAGILTLVWMAILHILPERWPFQGGPRNLRTRTRDQIDALRLRLEDQGPWPIGLVGETRSPFENHQVLACSCDVEADDSFTLHVYDPNCPGMMREIAISLREGAPPAYQSCPGKRGELRGIFCTEYTPSIPPSPQ